MNVFVDIKQIRQVSLALSVALLITGCGQNQRIKELEAEVQELKSQLNRAPHVAAVKAIREMKKINSVTEMGLNYEDYRKVLLEVKPTVDEALSEMPDGTAKESLSATMNAYTDAGRYWNLCIKKHVRDDLYAVFRQDEIDQFASYKLPFRQGDGDYYWGHPTLITNFWAFASMELLKAEALSKHQNPERR